MSIFKIKFKTEPTTRYLARKFGGKWRYLIGQGWECEDGNRYVHSVLTGRDYDGEYTGDSRLCLYYRDNSNLPEWC